MALCTPPPGSAPRCRPPRRAGQSHAPRAVAAPHIHELLAGLAYATPPPRAGYGRGDWRGRSNRGPQPESGGRTGARRGGADPLPPALPRRRTKGPVAAVARGSRLWWNSDLCCESPTYRPHPGSHRHRGPVLIPQVHLNPDNSPDILAHITNTPAVPRPQSCEYIITSRDLPQSPPKPQH